MKYRIAAVSFAAMAAFAVAAVISGCGGAGQPAADAGRIAFESSPGDPQLSGIYTMNSDGTDKTRVGETSAFRLEWSPDGRQIAFTVLFESAIYVMNADGSDLTRLVDDASAFDLSWSPDSNHIVFVSDRRDGLVMQVYIMNADGTDQTLLTDGFAWSDSPAWSPDGGRIAFTSLRDNPVGDVYVVNVDGTAETRLTTIGARSPAWSPDGSRIAFVSDSEIYVVNADGTGQTPITGGIGAFGFAWSPDGASIAFEGSDLQEIYVAQTDGSGVSNVTDNSAADSNPTWSPDGNRIAFQSDRDGNNEIYVLELAGGSSEINISNNPDASDFQPVWAPAETPQPTEDGPTAEPPSATATDQSIQEPATSLALGGEGSVSFSFTCAVTGGGGALCWGGNNWGTLGDGTTIDRPTPAQVSGLTSDVVALAAGDSHACALTTAGAVKCWGLNNFGQLGSSPAEACGIFGESCSTTPKEVIGLTEGVSAITAGTFFTCAITKAGGAKCWGANGIGQLGDGGSCIFDCMTPVDVSGLAGVVAIDSGSSHTCALTASGSVKCWGFNDEGVLGATTTEMCGDGLSALPCSSTPLDVAGLPNDIVEITAGTTHTCALTSTGAVKCWGSNPGGQLGDGTTISSTEPVDVLELTSDVTAISAGLSHTCALTSTGGVKCWGRNFHGQLGDGTTTDRTIPVDVSGLTSGVVAMAAGSIHACAITSAAEIKCWGGNEGGQLGDGSNSDKSAPVTVSEVGSN